MTGRRALSIADRNRSKRARTFAFSWHWQDALASAGFEDQPVSSELARQYYRQGDVSSFFDLFSGAAVWRVLIPSDPIKLRRVVMQDHAREFDRSRSIDFTVVHHSG